MNEQAPLPRTTAAAGEARCFATFLSLLLRGRIHLRRERVGAVVRFADGTSARIYRETVVDRGPPHPCTLVVAFRLRVVRGWGHTAFRWESLLNTPLFVGFPGFVSKLWLANDERGVYRGIYDWDGAELAERYARSLWRVLELVCVPGSIRYVTLPGVRRDDLISAPDAIGEMPGVANAWWRPVHVEVAAGSH